MFIAKDLVYITTEKGNKKIGKIIKLLEVKDGEQIYLCSFGNIHASVSEKKLTKLYLEAVKKDV